MHDSYKRKYGHTWDLNSKDVYTFKKYDDLIPAFELALILAYDDVMLIVDNFDRCSREMKLKLIFAVVDMAARHKKNHRKNVDDKMEEVLSSLSDIQIRPVDKKEVEDLSFASFYIAFFFIFLALYGCAQYDGDKDKENTTKEEKS